MRIPSVVFTLLTLLSARPLLAAAPLPLPEDWYPESVAAASDGTLYVGSWRQGAVARLRPGSDTPEILVPPGSNGLANAQGVLVDETGHSLWVCSGNMGFTTVPQTPSALKRYDLASGKPLASYPLPDNGYCNDLAQDSAGNLYVSDSKNPRILRLGKGADELTIWWHDAAYPAGKEGFYLNGITLEDDRTLYFSAVTAEAALWRLSIKADGQPGPLDKIAVDRALKNADAIRSAGPKRLVVFESNAFGNDGPYGGQISSVRINGTQASTTTLVAGLNDPSSGAMVGNRIAFIESKYGLLIQRTLAKQTVPLHVPFDVQYVPLP
ncbi:hypothetical protein SAMN02745857_00110 [Andreprevotia lacus DSM 23236]|jgi:sugar lactone lactonase YvrE|uniref:Sugar lactone lactonase YvrE n=1 Tax=Andreprevotia lacus DSM 23236 TaxID=1121001 RepID=A0A1W1WX44_9NEIS|nr:hypothetical protein [Andreprevotia lacus]SMC16150.1 hypothetical protein SAMN02745857_00110 [Andreprevotia lacus DSM 23236]